MQTWTFNSPLLSTLSRSEDDGRKNGKSARDDIKKNDSTDNPNDDIIPGRRNTDQIYNRLINRYNKQPPNKNVIMICNIFESGTGGRSSFDSTKTIFVFKMSVILTSS